MLTQRTTNPKTLKPELNEHLHSISNDFICTTKCSAKSTKHMKKPSTFFPPHIKLKQKKPTAKSKPQMLTQRTTNPKTKSVIRKKLISHKIKKN